ncbi:DUF3347 domain-containing protein [Chryseobacterium taklimakanense]|uniref:DUF3347 domain-containing protein n=1 Tax=Chryseobacterium taklimakanense TaxID=536441 RepID=UPI001EF649B3|nr:DUF3347 domain-containing protein [Chryseobacterium taklimakanense]MCG7279810.1 DUF3347 domain-containing protein [Chryseobacterium taklimakanense]
MKTVLFSLLAVGTFALTSCKENKEQKSTTETSMKHDMSTMSDSAAMGNMATDKEITVTEAKKSSADLTELYSHYTHLTFALSGDDDKEAVSAAKGILVSFPKIDKNGFSDEQKKEFAELEASIREHAEHIADNAGKIDHQREHLDIMSTDFYDLLKDFGTPKPVYKVFCPMYNDKKGAFWLSDSREVKNPYYGKEMLSCGEVQEEIK